MVDQLKPEHFLFYTLEKIKSFRLYEPNFFSTSNKPACSVEKMQPTSPEHFPSIVEKELPKNPTRKQKQPISIPFIWETKPGIPKNDWNPVKPSRLPPPPPCQHPINPITSNPFEWEEKPEIPFSSFSIPTEESGRKDENIPCEKSGIIDENKILCGTDFEAFHFETNKSVPFELECSLVPLQHQPPIKTIAPFSSWEEKTEKPHSYNPFLTIEFETDYPFGNTTLVGDGHRSGDGNEKISESNFETFCFETNEPFNQLEPPPHPPIKLIASVPFKWEEKPGKPLPSFPFPSTLAYFRYTNDHESDYGNEYASEDERVTFPESDFELQSFHTDESFDSVPSLLANRLVPSVNIANAIPVLDTPVSPPGYESDSSTSSCVTGTTSLVGKPLLDRLFPLLSPKMSFLEKVEEKEKIMEVSKTNLERKVSVWERGFSVAMRRPVTLEELIMMSRRRSCIRKAVPIKRKNSMGSMKKIESGGCFMFGINDRIEELQRKMKRQLQLKLI